METNGPYRLTIEDAPDAGDVRFVEERLAEFNRAIASDDNYRPLAVLLRGADNRIQAGLLGETYWGWLHVRILWVDENLRGQGYGTALLAAAEEEARLRGCRYAHVDTLSFQAPGFYQKHGYAIFGELRDLPPGHTRHFMMNALGG